MISPMEVRRPATLLLILPALSLILALPGCGGGGGPVLAPVEGTVNYQGKPLAQGEISFHPADGQRPAYGRVENGRVVGVATLEKAGVPVGPCNVAVKSVQEAPDMYTPSKSLIPERYADPAKSGLSATIEKGKTNQVQFDLQ